MQRSRADNLTAIAVFLLLAAPRARVGPAGIPVYAFDFVGVLAFIASYRLTAPVTRRIRTGLNLSLGLALTIMAAQAHHAVWSGSIMEPTYMAVRYLSAGALAMAAYKSSCRYSGRTKVLAAAIAGMAFTATISVCASLPQTRFIVTPVFGVSLLNPTAEYASEQLSEAAGGMRGHSLVGTSTLTGAFLAIGWPLALLAAQQLRGRALQSLAYASSFWIAVGALATYSRGALVALCAAALALLLRGSSIERRASLALISATVLAAIALPKESDSLMVDRYQTRFAALADGARRGGQFENESESERLRSWTEPVVFALAHPETLLLGYGNARSRTNFNHPDAPDFFRHSLPSKTYYYFGVSGFVLFARLLWIAFVTQARSDRRGDPTQKASSACGTAAFAAAGVWFIVGHAAISTIRGFALTLFIVALALASCSRGGDRCGGEEVGGRGVKPHKA